MARIRGKEETAGGILDPLFSRVVTLCLVRLDYSYIYVAAAHSS